MAGDRRSRSSASSSRGRGAGAMNSLEPISSLQPWACSSLASSEKFLSLYEKMQEDREKKNLESLVCTPCVEEQGFLQEEQQHFPALLLPPTRMMVDKPSSKIVFPHITSRGSLVGKKVHCSTSIHTSFTWRQKSSTQRMHTSLMILNYYQDRSGSNSNRLVLGGNQEQTQSSPTAGPADSVTSLKRPDHSLDKGQCTGLFLSLAGAAGMRLICPPLQLPLLEILLFVREQLSKNRRAAALSQTGGPGLWRFPVNLALATLRPFCGSAAGRCLTALLCLVQMRVKENNSYMTEQHDLMRYMSVPADLSSVARKKECNDLDSKECTKICSSNQFHIDDLVITMTDADDSVAAADRIGRHKNDNSNNRIITHLSNVVVGPEFEECWSNNGLQVVEILISESEESFSDHSVSGRSADSEFSLVDLEEDSSSEPCLTESEKPSSENVLVFTCRNGFQIGEEQEINELFAQSNSSVSAPVIQLPWEAPSSSTVVSAIEDSEGPVAEDPMALTRRICLSQEEEKPDSTSLSLRNRNLKTFIDDLAYDEEPCSTSRECHEGAVEGESRVSTAQTLAEETVEKRNQVGNELHDSKFVRFDEAESADRVAEQEVYARRIAVHRNDETNCIQTEELQVLAEVSLFERTGAESELEKESSNNLPGEYFKVEFDGDAGDFVSVEKLQRTTDVNDFEKVDVMVPVESVPLILGEFPEYRAVKEPQEVKSEVFTVETFRFLDSPVEEHLIGGSVSVSPQRLPDLFELLMESNWSGARKEFAKAAISVPAEKPSPALTGVAENQAVKNRLEGKFSPSGGETSAVKVAVDQGREVGTIGNQAVEDSQEVKSEHCIEEKVEEDELRIGSDDGDDWLESLLEQVEVFISERADVLSEHERAAATEVVENHAVKDIQEVNSSSPVEGILPESFLDQDCEVRPMEENRIDDGNCIPSASIMTVSAENLSLSLTENVDIDVVKEIQEVNTSNLTENKPADGLLNRDVGVCPVEDHRIGDRDCELLSLGNVQGECNSFISVRTSAGTESVKGVSVEVPSSAVMELFEDQPLKEIQEVKSSDFIVEKYENRIVDQSEMLQVQGEVSLPARVSAGSEPENELSENLRGRNVEVDFADDASVPQQEQSDPESKLICWSAGSSSESSEQTSLTSRLHTATGKTLDANGAITVVPGDKRNCDKKDGHLATETKVLEENKGGSIVDDTDSQRWTFVSASGENGNLNRSSAVTDEICGSGENKCSPDTCSKSSKHPFADHPKCIELRERRHSHKDQTYMAMQELLPAPWGQLIFWHGRCKEGRPTLCVLLGKAVRQLPGHELKNFIEVTVSHLEYAELNFFKGNVKQMNILMDLEGLGFMRLPPMHILSAIGAVLNRDYAGRGGWIILVNAPLMLGFVISAIQGVILRPSNNKGAAIDSSFKGFLEGKERIMMMGGKYRQSLQKHFDTRMLPITLGGDCHCGSDELPCKFGNEFLKSPWDTNSHV